MEGRQLIQGPEKKFTRKKTSQIGTFPYTLFSILPKHHIKRYRQKTNAQSRIQSPFRTR
jgi:hypothetical protein